MLSASMRIARGMGSKTSENERSKSNGSANGNSTVAKVVGPDGVGNARLGLWLGERLLGKFLFSLDSLRRKELTMIHLR